MTDQFNVGRKTLLHKHPSLKFGVDTERNVFWIVTSLIAIVLSLLLLIETILNWEAIINSTYRLSFTATLLLASIFWIFFPVFLNRRFPRWLGLVGYFSVMSVVAYHFAFSKDPVSVNTALQIMPVSGLYLGWFWRPLPSRLMFLLTVSVLVLAVFYSPIIAVPGGVPASVIFFAILFTAFAFFMGAFLRWQLQRKAMTDQLTGVLNRKGIRRALKIDISRAFKHGEPLTVAAIDFDSFKKLNDTKGHSFGDFVLVSTVEEWLKNLRPYDKIGRRGGDEFLIVFPKTTREQATVVLDRFKKIPQFEWTWGLAQLVDGDGIEQLLERADQNLYHHKNIKKTVGAGFKNAGRELVTSKKEQNENWLRSWYRSQSDFSVMSAALSSVVLFSMLGALLFQEIPSSPIHIPVVVSIVVLLSAVCTTVPLLLGRRYPLWGALVIASVLLLIYLTLTLISGSFYEAISLLFATSLLAIYLGVFLGDRVARGLLVSAIILISSALLFKYWPVATQELKSILIASILYALVTQLFLFEVGSYLYSRSRLHAHHDELTTVLNRYGLEEYGKAELQRSVRGNYPLSVAVLDCINFKKVNDTWGHAEGDVALRSTALHIASNLTIYDLVARTGGDEFVIFMPYIELQEAKKKLRSIYDDSPLKWSVGVVEHDGYESFQQVVSRADKAMYLLKGEKI